MKIKKLFLAFVIFSIFTTSSLIAQSYTYSMEMLLYATQQNHPELLKLQEEYKRSLLDVKDAWASVGPTLDLQASGTYMLNPPVGPVYINTDDIINSIQWNGAAPARTGQYVKIFDGMENTLYNFELTLTQPLFTWGKIANSIKLYKQISAIKQNQIVQQTAQLETELKTRLISLYYLNMIMKILDEEQSYAERMVQVSEDAEKSGMLLHQEVVDAKIQAKELEIAKQDLLEQIDEQLLELGRITGISIESSQHINYDFVQSLLDDFDRLLQTEHAVLEEEILSANQSAIKLVTQLEDVSKIAESISRGYENWKPDFALQMSGGYAGSRFPLFEPNWLRKDDYSLNITIGLKATVWDGGKKLRDVSRKVSEVKTAQITTSDTRSSISKTFDSQWNTTQVCTMKIEYQDLKIESATAKINQKQQMFDSGYGSETDVLSAKIERCNAQIEKEKQTLSRAIACLTIEYLRK